LPMDGPAPAIVNAVEDALGVCFDSIPLLPEDIFEKMTAPSPDTSSPVGDGVR
jgi:CO/xanthine dehydrogenase Mo-binding subunit